jgi:hypothetical protein
MMIVKNVKILNAHIKDNWLLFNNLLILLITKEITMKTCPKCGNTFSLENQDKIYYLSQQDYCSEQPCCTKCHYEETIKKQILDPRD